MIYSDAVTLFEALATERGQMMTSEDGAVVIRGDCGCLRLRSASSGIVLEITHGPADGSAIFWLDLYSEPVGPDAPSLSDSIGHGLELMAPGSGSNPSSILKLETPFSP
jgi:hypothetical protein